MKKKEKCKGGECCIHGTRCNEFYPDGCHVHFNYDPYSVLPPTLWPTDRLKRKKKELKDFFNNLKKKPDDRAEFSSR